MSDDLFCQFPTSSRDFLESLSKLLSSSAEDSFERRKILSNKEVFFKKIRNQSKKKFWIFGKKAARQPNFCSGSPEEHFEGNNVVQKKVLSSFSLFERQTLGRCPKNFWLRSLNCILKIQEVIFHHISWCSIVRWPILSVSDFLQRFFGEFNETVFFERWGSFWEKKSFFEKRSVFNWFSELEPKKF